LDEKVGEKGLTPLEWGKAKVRVELAHQGLVHQLESGGSFFRLGSDPRCEWCIPTLPAPVVAYVQVGPGYLSVLELVDSRDAGPVEPICLLPGGTVWLQPNARMTLSALAQFPAEPETFSWETFHAEDIKVFPNTLVVRSGILSAGGGSNHFRLQSSLSLLGTSPGCHVQVTHRNLSKFQAIVFRGELQGQPMRVVDLFGATPTLLNGRVANGEILEVGQELQIGGVRFEAVRFLYHASRPDHLIQVGHSFPTLPLPSQRTSGTVPTGGVVKKGPQQGQGASTGGVKSPVSQQKPEVAPAIGFDLPSKSKNSIHFDLHAVGERVVAPIAPATVSSTPPPLVTPVVSQVVPGASKADLQEVQEKSIEALRVVQKDLSEQIRSLTKRLDGIEEAIEYFPMAMQENSDQLMQAMSRLCETVSSISRPVPEESAKDAVTRKDAVAPKESEASKDAVTRKDAVAPKESEASKDAVVRKEAFVGARNKSQATGRPADRAGQGKATKVPAQKLEPVVLESTAPAVSVTGPAVSVTGPLTLAVQKAEAEAAEKKSLFTGSLFTGSLFTGEFFSKWTVWWKKSREATPLPENEEIQRPVSPPTKRKAEKDFVGESVLVNSSNTTARRSRLQSDPNSAEILASHESEDETLVLGSLMGLRYRDAKTALLRWVALFGLFFVIAVVGGPLAWYRIPQGWRELIWQKITFAPAENGLSLPEEVEVPKPSKPAPLEPVGEPIGSKVLEVEQGLPSPKPGEESSPAVTPAATPEVTPEASPEVVPEVVPSLDAPVL